jgi:hypothetical protein
MDMRYHWMSLRITMANVMDIKVCFTLIIIISFRYNDFVKAFKAYSKVILKR